MIEQSHIQAGSDPLEGMDIPDGWQRTSGKVREALWSKDRGVLITTDRVSAYDTVLGEIPGKGAVLNQLSLFWLEKTGDIVPNHMLEVLGPRSVAVKRCQVLPVEVIVRGYLTGSAWRAYRDGRPVSGLQLPAGLREFHRFETPIITPTTKADMGDHDEAISREEILGLGVINPEVWQRVEAAAVALFRRGTEIAAANGLVLVDTKYEFGLYQDDLHVVDEIHTPDSSRYWYADDLASDLSVPQGSTPRQLDKEFLRDFLRSSGFTGDGTPPRIPPDVGAEVIRRYCETYRLITGSDISADLPPLHTELPAVKAFLARSS